MKYILNSNLADVSFGQGVTLRCLCIAYLSEHKQDQSNDNFITMILIKLRIIKFVKKLGVGVIVTPCGFAVHVCLLFF